jgi:hypothetical protein
VVGHRHRHEDSQVIIAFATCVRQSAFPQRQPNPARDLMDVQAVIVPGIGVAACQAGADNTRANQMLQRAPERNVAREVNVRGFKKS